MNIVCRGLALLIYSSLFFLVSGCVRDIPQDPCSVLVPPSTRDSTFVYWVINQEEQFKRKGCWDRHVRLGDEAMEVASTIGDKGSVKTLAIQLASTWFYLGDAEKCKILALSARKLAIESGDRKAEVQSLYLLSAAERAQANIQAINTAEQALAICNRYLPTEYGLKGKVLYNLAAAESEIQPVNIDQAEKHLREAVVLFDKAGKTYDVLRVGIRLAKVEYQQGSYSQAEKTVLALRERAKSPREEMIYYYQLAKIQHHQEKWQLAGQSGNKALILAKQLDAKMDIERINRLMEAIHQQQFLVE